MSTQAARSVTQVRKSIIRNEFYEEHHHQLLPADANKTNGNNSTFKPKSAPRNNDDDDKQQRHLLRNRPESPPGQPEIPLLESAEQTTYPSATYAAYAAPVGRHELAGRAARQPTRHSRPPRRPTTAGGQRTGGGRQPTTAQELEMDSELHEPVGDNGQRVRLSEHFTRASGRSQSAAPAQSRGANGAGGRGSDHAPYAAVTATRMGRFVDSYPASRQARSSHRSTSPYAFHVPPACAFNAARPSDRQSAIYATPTSRATSPSYAYAEYYYTSSGGNEQPVGARGPYGYVARAEGDNWPRQPAAIKFNRSLRSRTIAHLPSMVQVTNGELHGGHEETELLHQDQARVAPATLATSEGDLLKAHTIAWRSSDLGRENPFRPGTELSLEADLMVRLIKRGYPIDELPRLVEAAKSEVAAKGASSSSRSKSCDRLSSRRQFNQPGVVVAAAPSGQSRGGYLRANLRREAERSRPELAEKPEVQTQPIDERQDDSDGPEPEVRQLDGAKAVWASCSLKRAKSMPRFATTCPTDVDSLDQLITSIELEISDLLEKTASAGLETRPQLAKNKHLSEKVISGQTTPPECRERVEASKTGSPIKVKVSPAKRHRGASSRAPSGETAADGRDLRTGAPRPREPSKQVAPAPVQSARKKEKPKCCLIQ